jgi:hypothetical protein
MNGGMIWGEISRRVRGEKDGSNASYIYIYIYIYIYEDRIMKPTKFYFTV